VWNADRGANDRRGVAREHFSGVYLITPFLHDEITSALVKFARKV
jgi:hypothetical protein